MVLGEDEDVFGSIPTRRLLFDPPTSSATTNSPNIIPPTPLLSSSSSTFSPPANPFSFDIDTTQYSYTSPTDSLHFFDPSPSISPSRSPSSPETPKKPSKTPSSSPSKTPKAQQVKENSKKKHRSRRSGKARALGLTGSSGGERSGVSTRDASSPRTTPKKGKGRAEAEPSSPFAEADHSVPRMPTTSSPSRAALQPAPELFTSGYKTVTLSKSARTFSPMSSPVRGVQQRRRVPLGLSSSANIENKGAITCAGRIGSSSVSTSSQNHRQNVASPSSLMCSCRRTFRRQASFDRHVAMSVACRRGGLGLGF